jgi:hypothetical protein
MSPCALGFDADDVANALRGDRVVEERTVTPEHVASCASCRRSQRLFEEVHATWRDAQAEDDRSRAVFREQRLAHGVRLRRRYVSWWGYAAVAGALLATVVARPWRFLPRASAPSAPAPVVAREVAPPASRPASDVGVVVLAASGEISPAVEIGTYLPRKVHVAAGARLTLAWSFARSNAAVIAGPVDLSVVGEGSSMLLVVGGVNGKTGASDGWVVHAGESLAPVELPRETEAPRSKPPQDAFDPAKEFARGVASLSAGDRGAAQRSFRIVADSHSASASLRHRAVFRWAELELARGESARARAELADLLADADLSLAADAAFLLARSVSAPADRCDVWGRYLARRPGTPYREDATLERAAALIDAGRKEDAADLLAQLSTEATLSKVQEARLRALQSQIGP